MCMHNTTYNSRLLSVVILSHYIADGGRAGPINQSDELEMQSELVWNDTLLLDRLQVCQPDFVHVPATDTATRLQHYASAPGEHTRHTDPISLAKTLEYCL